MKNRDLSALKNPIFGGRMGVATTLAPKGLGPQNPTKNLAHWVDLMGRPISRKSVVRIFVPNPTPLLKTLLDLTQLLQ